MTRPCPNCGASVAAEARFCRLCGKPLKAVGTNGALVSPRAKTVPLSDEGRTTNGLATDDGGAQAPDTKRVGRAEMDSFLRRSPQAQEVSGQEQGSTQAAAEADGQAVPAITTALSGGKERSAKLEPSSLTETQASTGDEPQASTVEASRAEKQKGKTRPPQTKTEWNARRMWQFVALALLLVAVGAALLAFYYSRSAGSRDADNAAQPISISDQQRLVAEKLSEAERLLASGNVTEAMPLLRYAIKIDPSNAKAHRLLAEALERTGAVTEAIDEYKAATRYDPNDEQTWLRYADALKRVGRMDEARDIYQKLSSSASEEVARTAKEQLAGLPPATVDNTEQAREGRTQDRPEEGLANTANVSPTSNLSQTPPANMNNAGAGRPKPDPVASYQTAMKIVEGKDIKKMNRAELIRAYELFQYAQSGPNSAEATRHLRELDKVLFEGGKPKR